MGDSQNGSYTRKINEMTISQRDFLAKDLDLECKMMQLIVIANQLFSEMQNL